MSDVFQRLYDDINGRKSKAADLDPYTGGNGRIDRCVQLVRQRKLPSQGVLLDVGGAIGNLGYALRDEFKNDRIVFDISEVHRPAAEAKGNRFICSNVDLSGLSPVEDLTVDLVAALDFIEHIVDPEKFARECFRVVRSGGAVFINTPNIRFWGHIEELVCRGTFPHTSGDREVFHGGHVAFYTHRDMVTIFSAAGFTKFEQFRDEQGFKQPPMTWLQMPPVSRQSDFMRLVEEFGNPNLLFVARK